VWSLPGGGLDPGESHIDALHRELIEEVGLHDPVIGRHVWNREHIIPHDDGLWDGQRDRYYLVDAQERFDPAPALSWEQLRAERLHELRWWHLDDIERATLDGVWFSPRALASHLRALVADGPPATPIDTGV
jgi:8-oxo-dGTP pyrophosphatase MutT (NUDIX family)